MENLRFGKEKYFHVLIFYKDCFIKELENIFPPFFGLLAWSHNLGYLVLTIVEHILKHAKGPVGPIKFAKIKGN